MKTIRFCWQEEGSLFEYLSRPFDRLLVELDQIGRPVAVRLLQQQTTTVEVSSRMHDVGRRAEVGVLQFSRHNARDRKELNIDVSSRFGVVVAIDKLVIVELDASVESGVVFKNARGEEIVIVAGVWPFGLAISVPWATPLPPFDPEYPLEQYSRVPVIP